MCKLKSIQTKHKLSFQLLLRDRLNTRNACKETTCPWMFMIGVLNYSNRRSSFPSLCWIQFQTKLVAVVAHCMGHSLSGIYTAGASRAMTPIVGLKSPHDVIVATRGLTQLANYLCEVALGMGWAFVRPYTH